MHTSYPRLLRPLLTITRLNLPGWGQLCHAIGVFRYDNDRWCGAPGKMIRSNWHGCRMRLRVSDRSEWMTFFRGRYFDLPTQLLMSAWLKPVASDVISLAR
jgi:hypothetical protein